MKSGLRTEMRAYRRLQRSLVARHHGRFVLIGGRTLHGIYDTESEALTAGYRLLGDTAPFLVRRIERADEEVTHYVGIVSMRGAVAAP